jgi:hypothetical protein
VARVRGAPARPKRRGPLGAIHSGAHNGHRRCCDLTMIQIKRHTRKHWSARVRTNAVESGSTSEHRASTIWKIPPFTGNEFRS